ncbi:MAG: Stp1/IreP family PP2C-type Ser/Thr phosphatase [Dehalobacter sp. 4CP]|uniref:Stp1/IreP family PP2C-type Ser/Thr phosphatase n=1 Tax=Dehalobacter sp. CP TaxID=2594474 RepID=UPI0013C62933|nr:Stp1/IreP family PP2C-type Ser/Thr phosphatase [Dehalobacter sp. 4CP]
MKAVKIYETGCVRKNNEDYFLILPEESFFAVADGMGGHNAGEIASRIAVEQLEGKAAELKSSEIQDLQDWIVQAVNQANREVYEVSLRTEGTEGMGTTLTALMIYDNKAVVGHVGDSRIYLWRNKTLTLLSEDHSMVNELVRLGELTEEKAKNHPHKHVLSRALGVELNIDVDCFQLKVQDGDVFLLCTDGFSNEISDQEIAAEFSEAKSWDDHLETLKNVVIERGAPDNFTAICCIVER